MTEFTVKNSADILGLTSITEQSNVIINSTINLCTHSSNGNALTDGDEQNVALHELGHGLGILCTNNTGEIITPRYTPQSSAKQISTLDVYGVATVFAWLTNSSNFYPVNKWLPSQSVILPSNIQYQFLPVTPQNALPQTLADNPVVETLVLIFELLIYPEIFALVIFFTVVMVLVVLYPIKKENLLPYPKINKILNPKHTLIHFSVKHQETTKVKTCLSFNFDLIFLNVF